MKKYKVEKNYTTIFNVNSNRKLFIIVKINFLPIQCCLLVQFLCNKFRHKKIHDILLLSILLPICYIININMS